MFKFIVLEHETDTPEHAQLHLTLKGLVTGVINKCCYIKYSLSLEWFFPKCRIVRDWTYFDWARTPVTSAYKSAIICTFPVLVPEYLKRKRRGRVSIKYNFVLLNSKRVLNYKQKVCSIAKADSYHKNNES